MTNAPGPCDLGEPYHQHPNNGTYHENCTRCLMERAAPDLLQACKAAAKYWRDGNDVADHAVIMDLDSAIHKATSQSHTEATKEQSL